MKAKIKVNFKDFYEGLMETARKEDRGKNYDEIVIEGELVEESPNYKFEIGQKVFVKPYTETPWGCERRVCGQRWGTIKDTNKTSPKRDTEGVMYFVTGKESFGGWEKEENIEAIS
jgi:hypothetical protein